MRKKARVLFHGRGIPLWFIKAMSFYVTNTKCRIFLDHVDIKQEEAQKPLSVSRVTAPRGAGESWLSMEEMLSLRPKDQTLSGRIVTDTISKLDLTLGAGSTFTGSTQIEENRAASKSGRHPFCDR